MIDDDIEWSDEDIDVSDLNDDDDELEALAAGVQGQFQKVGRSVMSSTIPCCS